MTAHMFSNGLRSTLEAHAPQALSRSAYSASRAEHHQRRQEELDVQIRHVNSEIGDARDELQRAAREVERLEHNAQFRRSSDADTVREIASAEAHRQNLTARRQALIAERDELSTERQAVGHAINAIERAVRIAGLELAPGASEPTPRRRTALVDVAAVAVAQKRLHDARTAVEVLETEISAVESIRTSRDDLVRALHNEVDAIEARTKHELSRRIASLSNHDIAGQGASVALTSVLHGYVATTKSLPAELLLALLAPRIKEAITEFATEAPKGLPSSERAKRLETLRAQRQALLLREESACRDLERLASTYVTRRASVPAEVLLLSEVAA